MLGERIKKLREDKEFSQKQLADMLSVGPSAISMWEQGRRSPDSEMLLKIAQLFNCSVDYLLGKTNIRNEKDLEKNIEKAKSIIETFRKAGVNPEEIDLKELEILLKGYYIGKNNSK